MADTADDRYRSLLAKHQAQEMFYLTIIKSQRDY